MDMLEFMDDVKNLMQKHRLRFLYLGHFKGLIQLHLEEQANENGGV